MPAPPIRLLLVLLVLVPLLAGGVTARPLAGQEGGPCANLPLVGEALVRQEEDLGPDGRLGSPALCLTYHATEDIYRATLLNIAAVEQYRAAKERAAVRLMAGSIAPCQIGVWNAFGDASVSLTPADLLDAPVECRPRVLAGDGSATALLDTVYAMLDGVIELTADQFGWRPYRPLTVLVMAEVEPAIATVRRYVTGLSAADLAMRVREGRSITVGGTAYGSLVLLNLVRDRSERAVRAPLVHEYTHFAQAGIGGATAVYPVWFAEGQALYQEEQSAGIALDLLDAARVARRDGVAPPLVSLAIDRDWFANERLAGSVAVYSAGYAAYRYLIEAYGAEAIIQLLHNNRSGSIERFLDLLTQLTGMEPAALDEAIGRWLVGG